MLKNRLLLLLCLAVLVSSFSACKTQKNENTNESETATTESLPDSSQEETKQESPNASNQTHKPEADTASSPWKEAYLTTLETLNETNEKYALVYIDNDDVPELYATGDFRSAEDGVYSFKNGSVIELRLFHPESGRYVEKSGKIYNSTGNMGNFSTEVYELSDNGFTQTFNALTTERMQWEGDEVILSNEFFIRDVPVSEAEYNAAIDAAYDHERSKFLWENAVTYDQIVEQIKSHQ